ncbi:MAG: M48 family metalloprotease [Candidatus Hydrogenedentes bacterium]|nr:M48 family metalloprotease [Candidatus Hydrogenedentota bacterium]
MKLRFLKILSLAALPLLFSTGCVTPTGGEQPNVLSTEDEIKLGATMSAEIDKEEKPLENNAIQVYVRKIGERLADQSPRQDVPYSFTVIDNPEVVNAFALPGGHMYVYTGLMLMCDNEAQLASVMAHEIGHVAAKHHGEAYTRQQMIDAVRAVLLGPRNSAMASGGSQILGQLFQLRFSRAQENEADAIGMDILFRAGYKPESMVDFMQKLASYEQEQGGRPQPRALQFFASHPATADRITHLNALLQRYPVEIRNQSPTYFERYMTNVLDVLQ